MLEMILGKIGWIWGFDEVAFAFVVALSCFPEICVDTGVVSR